MLLRKSLRSRRGLRLRQYADYACSDIQDLDRHAGSIPAGSIMDNHTVVLFQKLLPQSAPERWEDLEHSVQKCQHEQEPIKNVDFSKIGDTPENWLKGLGVGRYRFITLRGEIFKVEVYEQTTKQVTSNKINE